MRILFFRSLFKACELSLRGLTRLVRWRDQDPTSFLVAAMTPAQLAAQATCRRPSLFRAAPLTGRVLVVVPFRDAWALTERCLRALAAQKLRGLGLHVVLVDNGSTAAETAAGLAAWTSSSPGSAGADIRFSALRDDLPFNFSRLNNAAVARLAGEGVDWLLFLNNDVELTSPDSIADLVDFAMGQPDLGALGCTLTYPDGAIQHLFVAPGVKIVAAHPLRGRRIDVRSAIWCADPRPVAAATGACLLVGKQAFDKVGGFDEQLPTVGQDVDLCLRLQRAGMTNWVLPQVVAVHAESSSRRHCRINPDEVSLMYRRWGAFLTANSFFSSRLSRWSEQPALALGQQAYPWRLVLPPESKKENV